MLLEKAIYENEMINTKINHIQLAGWCSDVKSIVTSLSEKPLK